jgi:LGFP repeat
MSKGWNKMILETLFSGLGTVTVEKLLSLARQRNDSRLRAMIQEELEKFARTSPSNSIIVVNIHIGDLIQQVHILAESGLSPSSIIEAAHSHTLPALLSTEMRGRLGSPTSPEHETIPSQRGTSGRVQRFTDGASVYWSQRYGAFPTWGWIAQCYESLGGTGGRLGFPISLELEANPSERGTPGQVQRFEGGKDDPPGVSISIYCSQYGAFATWGWIARCYESFGGSGSRLGFPISPEFPAAQSPQGTSGQVQRFESNGDGVSFLDSSSLTGVSIYCSPYGAYATWGEIGRFYERLRGTDSRLGFPVSPEQETHPSSLGRTVWRQRFEGGEISCEWGCDPVVHA